MRISYPMAARRSANQDRLTRCARGVQSVDAVQFDRAARHRGGDLVGGGRPATTSTSGSGARANCDADGLAAPHRHRRDRVDVHDGPGTGQRGHARVQFGPGAGHEGVAEVGDLPLLGQRPGSEERARALVR